MREAGGAMGHAGTRHAGTGHAGTGHAGAGRAATACALALACCAALAAEGKRDFRGIAPGMKLEQAVAAAGRAGLACETSFNGRTTCRGDKVSVALQTTGRNGDHVYELQVILAGHYEADAMIADLAATYGLRPTRVPRDYSTAAGQRLMLLETGGSQTVFYLVDDAVLAGDAAALPPPKL